MNPDEIASTLEGIRERLASLSGEQRIQLPRHGFGDDVLGYFLPGDAGNPVPGRWCTVYSERGKDELRDTADSEDQLLWLLFESMLQSAATGWEVAHRIPHRDTRRVWFAKMAEWTAAYWPHWSDRLAALQQAILDVAPYDDAATVFAEFMATLRPAERQAVWRLPDLEAAAVRSAVIDLFHATGTLPSLAEVEARL
ncbi:Imm63 family immunity protein [Nocardioides ultimimeridianus]